MGLLKPKDVETIRQRFSSDLVEPVTIRFFTNSTEGLAIPGAECEYCPTTYQLLRELASLDSRISLEVHNILTNPESARACGVERIPAILLSRDNESRVRFYGIPAGFEFAVLLDDLIDISRGRTILSERTKLALASLEKDIHIQVFVTPTCPYCPRASRIAHAMAMESPRVRADVIEAMEFPALADRYGVYGVPKVVINETTSFEGALPEEAFLEHVLVAASGSSGNVGE
ncbi:MAG: thioredoxin family protein [Armatimonadota bacterium]|nr:thioredoxin family protein [Armatimonadota bacterium]MDR5703467.1 thioredoxin family protein [Armatimonadota bacterium]